MRGKIFAVVVACAALMAPLALAGEGAAQYVKINESEWGITGVPKKLRAGAVLHVAVTNQGNVVHELVLEKGNCAKQCAVVIRGHKAEIEGIKPGATKTATWTITRPGTYTFTCRVPGHWMAGMRKTFAVI
jgi:uncharacterized cupredoxin-like copper-binding protein